MNLLRHRTKAFYKLFFLMLAFLNTANSSPEKTPWAEAMNELLYVHKSDLSSYAPLLRDGDIVVVYKIISLDKTSKIKTYTLISTQKKGILIVKEKSKKDVEIKLKDPTAVASAIHKELTRLRENKIAQHPKKQHSIDAFGGSSSSIVALTSLGNQKFLRFGDQVEHLRDHQLIAISRILINAAQIRDK